jgi:acetylornithine deacetylase/succinyl-diaminopimelate desuccinylase-like protein
MDHPRLARLKVGLAAQAARQPEDAAVVRWAASALAGASAEPLVRIRMMGGTVPTHEIVSPLSMPFVLVPLVNPDNNQHTFDENLRLGNYLSGMKSILGLLGTPYPD